MSVLYVFAVDDLSAHCRLWPCFLVQGRTEGLQYRQGVGAMTWRLNAENKLITAESSSPKYWAVHFCG